ncbi:MAG TPA: MFS transporter [Acidimicrobiia bacterium]|jgi:EmrB/QacA subfamily drug resistance transporter
MHIQRTQADSIERRRWWILGVLSFSVLVIVLDNSVLNVALPSIQRELHASSSDLQWMVDAYSLAFAGLLLTMGSLGDKYGRRPALQIGFVIFGLGSLLSAVATSSSQLIATRAVMGVGAALIMPATLSIITNVFPAKERPKAIAIWTATAGVGVALGPITGGLLLEQFYWGSIFLVNLPIVAFGLLAGVFLIPDSRDPHAPRLDWVGAILSIIGLSAVLYGVIEAPSNSWTDPTILAAFAIGAVALIAFFAWEAHVDHPMLDLHFWTNPRFSAASGAIAVTFFALFGAVFLLTQYLQFVLGLTALETGVRLLASAIPVMVVSPLAPRIVARIGTKLTVAAGLATITIAMVTFTSLDVTTDFFGVAWRLALLGVGMGLTMAPATESIMGSLPLARAGVGSAVNDTTRELGGAVGVAVIGSVFSSVYESNVGDALRGQPGSTVAGAKGSVGAALTIASRLPGAAGRALGDVARHAFVDGFHSAVLVGAAITIVGLVAVFAFLPSRPSPVDVERQDEEFAAERASSQALQARSRPRLEEQVE